MKILHLLHQSPRTSIVMPPTLTLSSKAGLHRDDFLTSQLSTEKMQFKAQLTSLCLVSTPDKIQLNPNRYNDQNISCMRPSNQRHMSAGLQLIKKIHYAKEFSFLSFCNRFACR